MAAWEAFTLEHALGFEDDILIPLPGFKVDVAPEPRFEDDFAAPPPCFKDDVVAPLSGLDDYAVTPLSGFKDDIIAHPPGFKDNIAPNKSISKPELYSEVCFGSSHCTGSCTNLHF